VEVFLVDKKKRKHGPATEERKYGPDPTFEDKMTKRISAVVTDDQLATAKKLAKVAGKTVSTWARDIILEAMGTKK
jgi:hypothetical protein